MNANNNDDDNNNNNDTNDNDNTYGDNNVTNSTNVNSSNNHRPLTLTLEKIFEWGLKVESHVGDVLQIFTMELIGN